MKNKILNLFGTIIYLFLILILQVVIYLIFKDEPKYDALLISNIIIILILGINYAYLFKNKIDIKPIPKVTITMLIAVIIVTIYVALMLKYTNFKIADYKGFSVLNLVIFAPIYEELLCRGLILEKLKKTFSKKIAIIISSVIFALIHVYFIQIIYAFILGIILANYKEKKGIYLSIYAHIIYNLSAVLLSNII